MSSNSLETIPQSPVNISTVDTPTQSFETVLDSNYQSAPIEIFNNGNNIDGELATQENFITYQGEKYYLDGFHFHTQSEHTFNGQNTDGEIHLVHKSDTGKVLVVGITLEGVDPNSPDAGLIDPQLDSFLGKLDGSLEDTSTIIDGGDFNPGLLISDNTQVYNYGGSLTTGPYTDAAWVVSTESLIVNENTLENFRNLQKDFYYPLVEGDESISIDENGFNNREIQNELFLGTGGDNLLEGDRNGINGFSDDLMYARSGDDLVNAGIGDDKVFGEQGEDTLIGGQGDDLLVGDANLVGANLDSSDEDYLIGGQGKDNLYIMGDDIAVGGGLNRFDSNFIELLNNEPFELTETQKTELNLADGEQDTFVLMNDGNGYTTTIVGFEEGIDRLDLRAYSLGSVESPQSFQDIQRKDGGDWWEYKTAKVNGNEVTLRIDADPDAVNAALV